eukprot:scaffold273796_cov31-Tisochrysis_lutea.AAC.4
MPTVGATSPHFNLVLLPEHVASVLRLHVDVGLDPSAEATPTASASVRAPVGSGSHEAAMEGLHSVGFLLLVLEPLASISVVAATTADDIRASASSFGLACDDKLQAVACTGRVGVSCSVSSTADASEESACELGAGVYGTSAEQEVAAGIAPTTAWFGASTPPVVESPEAALLDESVGNEEAAVCGDADAASFRRSKPIDAARCAFRNCCLLRICTTSSQDGSNSPDLSCCCQLDTASASCSLSKASRHWEGLRSPSGRYSASRSRSSYGSAEKDARPITCGVRRSDAWPNTEKREANMSSASLRASLRLFTTPAELLFAHATLALGAFVPGCARLLFDATARAAALPAAPVIRSVPTVTVVPVDAGGHVFAEVDEAGFSLVGMCASLVDVFGLACRAEIRADFFDLPACPAASLLGSWRCEAILPNPLTRPDVVLSSALAVLFSALSSSLSISYDILPVVLANKRTSSAGATTSITEGSISPWLLGTIACEVVAAAVAYPLRDILVGGSSDG